MPRERSQLFRESNSLEKERVVVLAFEGNKTNKKIKLIRRGTGARASKLFFNKDRSYYLNSFCLY